MRARLRLDAARCWEPREQLLALREGSYVGDDETAKLVTLLGHWEQVARALGRADLAAALALQSTALREALNGDAMLDAFRAVPAEFEALREALFAQWRTLLVQRTLSTGPQPRA